MPVHRHFLADIVPVAADTQAEVEALQRRIDVEQAVDAAYWRSPAWV
jgi:hypothetical protein